MILNKILLAIPLLLLLAVGMASVDAESLIPQWVQNTALWYGQGIISEQEYIDSIKFNEFNLIQMSNSI